MLTNPGWLNKFRAKAPSGGGGGGGDITTGLVAWWKFDEGTGTSAADSTGNGHTGTLNGSAGWTTGRIGANAVAYSGGGTSFSAITTGTTFTYAAWIFPTSSGGFQNLFTEGGAQGLWFGEGAFIIYYFGGEHFNTTPITLNVWHHIAVVNNGGNVTFYVDGVADGTITSAPSFNANGMGADGGSSGEAFAGNHDDVRFYSRALSGTDIATLAGM